MEEQARCTTRLIVNWLGVIAVLSLACGVGLSVYARSEATVIVGIVGIAASVASGLIGYLGGRNAAQQALTTGHVDRLTVEGSPAVAPTPAPAEER